MYVDSQLSFNTVSDNVMTAQAETTVATHNSDNVIDITSTAGRHFLEPMYFVFQIETAIVSAGGGTLDIQLVCSAAAALTSPTVLWSSGVVANATIVAWTANSTVYVVKAPPIPNVSLRYVGVLYIIGTAVFSAGDWRAFLTPNAPLFVPATAG
jgi:hypothetical protein